MRTTVKLKKSRHDMRQPKNPEKRVLKAFGGLLYLKNQMLFTREKWE